MKVCKKCGIEKSFEAFPKDGTKKDGFAPRCKSCKSIADRERYKTADKSKYKTDEYKLKHKLYFREYRKYEHVKLANLERYRRYRRTDKGREKERRYKETHRLQNQARWCINNGIQTGKIDHVSIFKCFWIGCKKTADNYHHWNYDRRFWLSVIPLCTEHHFRMHQDNDFHLKRPIFRILDQAAKQCPAKDVVA